MAVHSAGQMVLGKPVAYNPLNPVGTERRRLKRLLEETIIAMYMQLEGGDPSGALMVQRM
jgi:hypothetical protein